MTCAPSFSFVVLGVGRHKVAPTKMSILSASTTRPFVLNGLYSRKHVSFSWLTVSFSRIMATVQRGEMPRHFAVCSTD